MLLELFNLKLLGEVSVMLPVAFGLNIFGASLGGLVRHITEDDKKPLAKRDSLTIGISSSFVLTRLAQFTIFTIGAVVSVITAVHPLALPFSTLVSFFCAYKIVDLQQNYRVMSVVSELLG